MKNIMALSFIIISLYCNGQEQSKDEFTHENFDSKIVLYQPLKRSGVSEKQFEHGIFLLNETKKAIKNDPENLTYADYWNIAMSFINLDESNHSIEIAFNKAIKLNPENVCTIIKSFGSSELDIRIPKAFYSFTKNCSNKKEIEGFDSESYSKSNNLNIELVTLMNKIYLNDIKYRFDEPIDWSKQKPLDEQNQKTIDSLFVKHSKYIGGSLVGEKFESTMWMVIQHSNIEMMEKYFPIIQKAVSENELGIVPFKMLIDRFYGLKFGYQVFGSQSGFGFKMAAEKIRKEIEIKFGIE